MSPIEERFDSALREAIANRVDCNQISYSTQVPVAGSRLDFLVRYTVAPSVGFHIVVELDGHDWHERTKEQASADRARDRDLLREGLITVRFTGSDVFRDARSCATTTLQLIHKLATGEYQLGGEQGACLWQHPPNKDARETKKRDDLLAKFEQRRRAAIYIMEREGSCSLQRLAREFGMASPNTMRPVFAILVQQGIAVAAGRDLPCRFVLCEPWIGAS